MANRQLSLPAEVNFLSPLMLSASVTYVSEHIYACVDDREHTQHHTRRSWPIRCPLPDLTPFQDPFMNRPLRRDGESNLLIDIGQNKPRGGGLTVHLLTVMTRIFRCKNWET